MLQLLSIRNFALIERADIRFPAGFSVITGETGAGKSIMLGALGLVLGKRADLAALREAEQKCVIEAHFAIAEYGLESFFDARGLDYDPLTILRRELLPSGKSRAFVNDSPVALSDLSDLGAFLIDVHSQHQTRELSDDLYQMGLVDALAGTTVFVTDFAVLLRSFRKDQRQLEQFRAQLLDSDKERDYRQFLLQELQSANLQPDMQEPLEVRLEELTHVETIRETVAKSIGIAGSDEFGTLLQLRELRGSMQKIGHFSGTYAQWQQRLESLEIELDDLLREWEQAAENLVADPQELQRVSAQLQQLYDLQQKHQVRSVEELMLLRDQLEQALRSSEDLSSEIEAVQQRLEVTAAELKQRATALSEKRRLAIPSLCARLEALLAELGMPHARLEIVLTAAADFRENGGDDIRFLFSANKGMAPGLLSKTASGGELSRIMLAVKSVLAEYRQLPVIIFDEIDTGVSGEIALRMADIMKDMGRRMQVVTITHLPQIASRGAHHFRVSKASDGDRTLSEIVRLDAEQRVQEVAAMLSGKAVSDSALQHARALLD